MTREHDAGKGDSYRSVDQVRYELNYDLCFGTEEQKAYARIQLALLDAERDADA